MELLGIGLGSLVALLWGSSDMLATVAAQQIGTFKTTFLSQTAGLLALFAFGVIAYAFLHLPFPPTMVAISMLIGIFTGVCAALGYFYFYRALETGPVTLVCPLTSTSPIFTLLLSVLLLCQHLTIWQIEAVVISIVGIVLASIHLDGVRSLLRTPGSSPLSKGIRWALIATLAFAAMDSGIGASATVSGWFLPILWTRIFSICSLTLISSWKLHQRRKQFQTAPTEPLAPAESAPSTWRSSEASLEDTVILQPFRSSSTMLSLTDEVNRRRLMELSHADTRVLPQDTLPLTLRQAQKASTSSSSGRTLSLSLPRLEHLSLMRSPLASRIGLAMLLAIVAGVIENTAALGFSLDTQIATTGIASAITSGYSLIVILFGIIVYHERLTRNQIAGITLFMLGLIFLALVP